MSEAPQVVPAKVNDDKLTELWRDLNFSVRRSIRYHTHRRKFFEGWDSFFCFLVIICGGSALTTSICSDGNRVITIITTGAIAILGALDLTIGFAMRARDYHDLARDFSALERRIVKIGDNPTWDDYAELHNQRLEIEEEEPAKKTVLDCYCHNELCRALDKKKDEYVRIWFFQSWVKQYMDVFPSLLKKYGDVKK
jgi:hypothetical protein